MATFRTMSGQGFTLASSISSTQTTIILSSFKVPVTGTNITMASMGTSIAFGTLGPGTTSSELISFTGVVQNANGTATLTGVTRGLDKEYPGTEVTAFKQPHAGQTIFILSDAPQVFNQMGALVNDNVWQGLQTFSVQNALTTAGDPVIDNEYARKAYVDSVATGGVSNNRTIIAGIAGETLAVDQLVYLKVSDGRWWLADADTASTVDNVILGITQGAGTAGNPVTSGVLTNGLHTFTSLTLTANTQYYASNTAGGFSSTPGTTEVSLGESQTTTTILFYPRFDQQLTENQQDALAGTSGTPSNTNRYVTNDDTATAATADKVVRRSATGQITVPTTPVATTDAASKSYVDLTGTKIATVTTDVTIASSTAETTLISVSIPGNIVGTNNAIRARLYFTDLDITNSNNCVLRFKYGTTTIASKTLTTSTGAMSNYEGNVECVLYGTGATNTQEGILTATFAPDPFLANGFLPPVYVGSATVGTAAEDSTGALNLVVTAQFSNSGASDGLTMVNATVEKITAS